MRVLFGLVFLLWSGFAQANGYLAIIIDDLGHNYSLGKAVLDLPRPVTASVLPRLAWSRRIASEAHRQGRVIMLHQPMTSIRNHPLGPGGLTLEHTSADMQSMLEAGVQKLFQNR